MSFEGVNVNQTNGNLGGQEPNEDGVILLIYGVDTGIDLPDDILLNKAYLCIETGDAVLLGFDESYDANNNLSIHQQVRDFFAYAPEAKLYLLLTEADSPRDMLNEAAVKSEIRANKDIKGIGIARHTLMADELAAHVEDVQGLILEWKTEKRLIDFVLLQGNSRLDSPWVYTALPSLREVNAPNVSVTIAQCPFIGKIQNTSNVEESIDLSESDLGSALGMIAVRKVNENLGSVDILVKPRNFRADSNYTLTRANRWKGARLSNMVNIDEVSLVQQKALTNKGYIFAGSYEGYAGTFFNSSPTAVSKTSDYSYIENNRTWNKAARIIRNTLLPKVKGIVKKNPQNGFIKSSTIAQWEASLNKALNRMVIADEISGFGVSIPANQIPDEENPVMVKAVVVKDGIAHEFDVDLGLANSI